MAGEKTMRVLIAAGYGGRRTVLATDSAHVAWELAEISGDPEDLGIPEGPPDAPLYLWEGTVRMYAHGPECHEESEYVGTCRVVGPSELPALLEMEPPVVCVICGQPATTHYPPHERPDEANPSCGSPRCEIQIQAGLDYIDDRG